MTISRKPNLNGSIICCIFAILLHSSKAQFPYTTKTFSGSANQVVSQTNAGNIFVTGNASLSEHRVEMYVESNDGTVPSNDEIQQRLDKYYTVKIDLENSVLNATAIRNKINLASNQELTISFVINVASGEDLPKELSISFVIDVTSETVSTELKTSGGNLNVRRIFGNIKGQTSGGNFEASNCGGENNALDLSTSGGDLHLNNLTGTINARTMGGNVRASALTGNITFRTDGGNLNLSNVSGGISATTNGGNIVTSMNKVTGDTRLKAFGESVDFSFPSGHYNLTITGDTVDVSGLNNFTGTQTQKEIKGQMNGGGTVIVVSGNSVAVKIGDEITR
ncbi:hypothetical protein Ddc_14197 [Ditylenchus destructor]|nr:hypothetical protein Ddc_14197 [Ditylenchus destructor]